jgi:hypothetical protein
MKKSMFLLLGIIIIVPTCFSHEYDPWGVWFAGQPTIKLRRINSYPYGTFYAYGYSEDNLFVLPYDIRDNSPSFAINGDRIKVEKYEKTDYGFLFIFEVEGRRENPVTGLPEDRDIILQVQMFFKDEDKCIFSLSKNADGFRLPFFGVADIEHKVYRRHRVVEEGKK